MAVSASAGAVRGPRGRAAALAERAWTPKVVVPLAFLLSAGWLAWQAYHVISYVWLVDELLYMKYAVSYSDLAGLMPSVHGVAYGAPNVLYPLLCAPLFWLLSTVDAFTAAHVLNGILFGSTLFPVYLLARRLGATWGWALLGGLAAVWVPWSVSALVLMTEATAYPAFAWAILAITVAVVDPRPRHDALAVVAIVVAILARTQLVFLVGVLPVAIAAFELGRRDAAPWRERLRAHRALLWLALAVAVAVALVELAGGNLLGAYDATTTKSLLPAGLWNAMMVHVAHMVVGVTIVPALMWGAWLLVTGMAPASEAQRAGAIVSGLAFAATVYQAGWFMQEIAGGAFQERYTLYVVALFAAGMAALAARAAFPAPRLALGVVTAIGVLAIAGSGFGPEEARGALGAVTSAGAALNARWLALQGDVNALIPGHDRTVAEILGLVTALAGIALALALAPRWRRWALPALCLLALLGSVLQTRWLHPRVITGIAQDFPRRLVGTGEQPRDWIDRAAPDGAAVGLQPGRLGFPRDNNFWIWTEFWNKEADREYTVTGQSPFTGWPGHRLDVDPASGRVATPEVPDLLAVSPTDPGLRLDGEIVARSAYGVALLRVAKPLQALWRLEQAEYDGEPNGPGRTSRLRIFTPDRAVAVTFRADVVPGGTGGRPLRAIVRDERGTRRLAIAEGAARTVVVRGGEATLRLPLLRLPGERTGTVRVAAIDEAR